MGLTSCPQTVRCWGSPARTPQACLPSSPHHQPCKRGKWALGTPEVALPSPQRKPSLYSLPGLLYRGACLPERALRNSQEVRWERSMSHAISSRYGRCNITYYARIIYSDFVIMVELVKGGMVLMEYTFVQDRYAQGSGVKPLGFPTVLGPRITQTLVEAIGAFEPELDLLGYQAKSGPEMRSWDFTDGKFGGVLR